MYAGLKFIPLVVIGVSAIIWGLPASHRLKKPYDIAAAAAVLVGVIALLLGLLLMIIPNFFR